jgi:hypothetical protein
LAGWIVAQDAYAKKAKKSWLCKKAGIFLFASTYHTLITCPT